MGEILGEMPFRPVDTTQLWVCGECYQDLLNKVPEVIDRFMPQECDYCWKHVNQRYHYEQFSFDKLLCSECMIRFMNIPNNYPVSIRRSVRGLMGDIEFKGNDCFIWDPRRIVLTREDGRMTTIDIETEGDVRGNFPVHRGASPHMRLIKNMFIKDGNIIWIAKQCNVMEVSIDTSIDHHVFSYDLSLPVRTGPNKVRLKIYVESVEFKTEEQVRREREARHIHELEAREIQARVAMGEPIYPGQRVEMGSDGFVYPVGSFRDRMAQPYYDADDRLFIWCTCGWQKKVYAIAGDTITHGQSTVVIPRMSEGDTAMYDFGAGHRLTIIRSLRPPNQPELEDLR